MRNYYMNVVMAMDKRCAASGRALQAESAASKIEHVKNIFVENFATSKQMHARKIVCGDEFTEAEGREKFSLKRRKKKRNEGDIVPRKSLVEKLKALGVQSSNTKPLC